MPEERPRRSTGPGRPSASFEPAHYGIAALATQAGTSQELIRAWERRYHALKPARTATGRRVYDDTHLERLRLLVHLIGHGHTIGHLAALPTPTLRQMASGGATLAAPTTSGELAESTRRSLVRAFENFDSEEATRLLSRASLAFAVDELWSEVLGPVLRELGELWQQGELSIAQEHAATSVIRGHLLSLLRERNSTSLGPVTIAATLEGEQHDLGALYAAIVSAQQGQRVIFLGGSVPVEDLQKTLQRTRASRLLLSVVALPASSAQRQLERLARQLPSHVEVVVGGQGAAHLELPARFRRIERLKIAV